MSSSPNQSEEIVEEFLPIEETQYDKPLIIGGAAAAIVGLVFLKWPGLFLKLPLCGSMAIMHAISDGVSPKFPTENSGKSTSKSTEQSSESSWTLRGSHPDVAGTFLNTAASVLPSTMLTLPSSLVSWKLHSYEQSKANRIQQRDMEYHLGRVAIQEGQPDAAYQHLRQAIRLHRELSRVASYFFSYQVAPRGDDSFEQLLEMNYCMAQALLLSGRLTHDASCSRPGALEVLNGVLKYEPEHNLSLRLRGIVHMQIAESTSENGAEGASSSDPYDPAKRDFEKYLQLNSRGHHEMQLMFAYCKREYETVINESDFLLFEGMDITENGLWSSLRKSKLVLIVLDKIARAVDKLLAASEKQSEEKQIAFLTRKFIACYNMFKFCREEFSLSGWKKFLEDYDHVCELLKVLMAQKEDLRFQVPLIAPEMTMQRGERTIRDFNSSQIQTFREQELAPLMLLKDTQSKLSR